MLQAMHVFLTNCVCDMHLAMLPNLEILPCFSLNRVFPFYQTFSMFLVLGSSIMFHTIGGQLDESLCASLTTCPVVIYTLCCYQWFAVA